MPMTTTQFKSKIKNIRDKAEICIEVLADDKRQGGLVQLKDILTDIYSSIPSNTDDTDSSTTSISERKP